MKIYKLKNKKQELHILSTGATLYKWICFKDKTNIVVSNYDINDYKKNDTGYLGATIGRYANRIENAKFTYKNHDYTFYPNYLNKHTLHGGKEGFNLKEFKPILKTNTKIILKYISKDMEEGFPGSLTLYVTYEIIDHIMTITYDAKTTKDTPINITNHMYLNLGDRNILYHNLYVYADYYIPLNKEMIPCGRMQNVSNTPLDFRQAPAIGNMIFEDIYKPTNGIDNLFILNDTTKTASLKYRARKVKMTTSYPCVQVYTMNDMLKQKINNGEDFEIHKGVALEFQYPTNALNHYIDDYTILKRHKTYHEFIEYRIYE